MAVGAPVDESEELVRALYYPLWDENAKRASTMAFRQEEVSVSRPAVLEYDAIVDIFKLDLNGRPGVNGSSVGVVATATVSVSQVSVACADAEAYGLSVRVLEDPSDGSDGFTPNPSHAIIRTRDAATELEPKTMTRGMANRLRAVARYREVA